MFVVLLIKKEFWNVCDRVFFVLYYVFYIKFWCWIFFKMIFLYIDFFLWEGIKFISYIFRLVLDRFGLGMLKKGVGVENLLFIYYVL